eukprot:g6165.t1
MEKSGLKANVVTFNCMIGSCFKNGDLDLARSWWDVMVASGIKPNRVTYNILISSCAKMRDAAGAEKWMCETLYRLLYGSHQCICQDWRSGICRKLVWAHGGEWAADSVVYNSMINACAKAGDIERADHWLERMLQAGVKPDDKTYNSLMHACDVNSANMWFSALLSKGHTPSTITYNCMVSTFTQAGAVDLAMEWLLRMLKEGCQPDAVTRAILGPGDPETQQGAERRREVERQPWKKS